MIADCCEIKAEFVFRDEREAQDRALLNLGHTFAHALETYTHYQRWLHGEAVAIGLYCAALLSHELGYLEASHVALVDTLLLKAGLPRRIPTGISLIELQALMQSDKKVKNNVLRFVLMKAPGDCFLEQHVPEALVHKVLTQATQGDE
jgi:3-dehydroquinate synthase